MNTIDIFKKAFAGFQADKASRIGAALAYYSAFSLAPLLIVVLGIAGIFYRDPEVRAQLVTKIAANVGNGAASFFDQILTAANQGNNHGLALLFGVAITLVGALGLFNQLKDAANTIWNIPPHIKNGLLEKLRTNGLSFLILLATATLLLSSLVLSAVLTAFAEVIQSQIGFPTALIGWGNFGLSFIITILLFGFLLQYLPDRKIKWSAVWKGAFVTAILFAIGKQVLAFYLGYSGISSSFGAAGSFAAILIWLYYASQILLFGIEFTKAEAENTPLIHHVDKRKKASRPLLVISIFAVAFSYLRKKK